METTVVRCSKRSHIHWSDEAHVCPTPEYIDARNKLVDEAATANEFGLVPEHETETNHGRKAI